MHPQPAPLASQAPRRAREGEDAGFRKKGAQRVTRRSPRHCAEGLSSPSPVASVRDLHIYTTRTPPSFLTLCSSSQPAQSILARVPLVLA
jgi:hypothetical protein